MDTVGVKPDPDRSSILADAWAAFSGEIRGRATDPRSYAVVFAYATVLALVREWAMHGRLALPFGMPRDDPTLIVAWVELLLVFLIGAALTVATLGPERAAYVSDPVQPTTRRTCVIATAKVSAAVAMVWLLIGATAVAMAVSMGTRDPALAGVVMMSAAAGVLAVTIGAFWSTVFVRHAWRAALASYTTIGVLAFAHLTIWPDFVFGGPWLLLGSGTWYAQAATRALEGASIALGISCPACTRVGGFVLLWCLPAALQLLLSGAVFLGTCARLHRIGRVWLAALAVLLALFAVWYAVGATVGATVVGMLSRSGALGAL